MHTETQIVIRADRKKIFDRTSDLLRWPAMLPHYRFVQVLEEKENGVRVVRMAALRGAIPISWVSEFRADPEKFELHFHHLRAFTKGMKVVWTYTPQEDGVLVKISHDLKFRIPILAPIANPIIGGYFIDHVARKTLGTFKSLLEKPE